MITTSTRANEGVVRLRVRCRIRRPCDGAFLLLRPTGTFQPPGLPRRKWIGGSDFHVGAHRTAWIEIGLTKLGARLARSPGGYVAQTWVVLYAYWNLADPSEPDVTVHG